jgi:penicillin-binding protein activator
LVERIRAQLNAKAQGCVRFLARERMQELEQERESTRNCQLTVSSDPTGKAFKGADFFLTGKLSGLTTKAASGASDYILYSFQLVDTRSSAIVWEDSAEIKKQGGNAAAHR